MCGVVWYLIMHFISDFHNRCILINCRSECLSANQTLNYHLFVEVPTDKSSVSLHSIGLAIATLL